jgi:hypothetical protein
MKPCARKNHDHRIPPVEGAGTIPFRTHGTYHLKVEIADRYGRPTSFIGPFVAIDRGLKDDPVLRHCDPAKPLRVETDASSYALAGILSQKHENSWHPIAYFSRNFRHWRHYLEGAEGTEVYSDHENLQRFMAQTSRNGRQTRWLIQLAPYDFQIFYRKGAINPADAPSRRCWDRSGPSDENTPISGLLPSLQAKIRLRGSSPAGHDDQPGSSPGESDRTRSSADSLDSVAPKDPEAAKLLPVLADQRYTRSEVRSAAKAAKPDNGSFSEPGTGSLSELVRLVQQARSLTPSADG